MFYTSHLLSKRTVDDNLLGSKTVKIPRPHYVVFYNGLKELPDRSIHKLSDSYITKDGDVNLELKVLVLNINKGHNEAFMESCKTLKEYAYYVQAVREAPESMTIEEKVEWAIDQCIKNDVLAEFLRTHRAEVINVSIFEYDAEKHLAMEKAESRAEGRLEGKLEGAIELAKCRKLPAEDSANILGLDKQLIDEIYHLVDIYHGNINLEVLQLKLVEGGFIDAPTDIEA